jgi:hypothetical protein
VDIRIIIKYDWFRVGRFRDMRIPATDLPQL